MTQVHYFVACSLDAYIAGPQDEIDWLFTDDDYGYADFIAKIDYLIMGRRTYDQVRSFGDWPYVGKPTYVITNGIYSEVNDEIHFTDKDPILLARELDGNCWLVGGGLLAQQFLRSNAIDIFHLAIHPILLGGGKPLFPPGFPRTKLKLEDQRSYPNGLMQLIYRRVH